MRKIVLLCAAGMSTSLLVTKMETYAKSIGYEIEIDAHPVSMASISGKGADIVLLGPQIRFNLNKVKELVTCPVEAIDMVSYGTMNGQKVIDRVKEILGD